LGSQRHLHHCLSSKGPNYQRGVLLISAGAIVLHDNAPAYWALATQKKLAYFSFQCLDHPAYTPDLTPSDYHLFPRLKKQQKGRHFSSDAEVIAAAETWIDAERLQKLDQRAKKYIELCGDYVE